MLQSSGVCILTHMQFAQLSMELFPVVGLLETPQFLLITLTFFVCKCLLWFFYPHCPQKFSTGIILWTMFCSRIERLFSRLLFLFSDTESCETEKLILLLYDERSHKKHPSPFLLLMSLKKDDHSNPFNKVAYWMQ